MLVLDGHRDGGDVHYVWKGLQPQQIPRNTQIGVGVDGVWLQELC